MKKTLLPLCAALLVTAGLASCGTNEILSSSNTANHLKKAVSLSVWVPTEQIDWAKEKIEKIKKANENASYRFNVSIVDEEKVYKKTENNTEDELFYASENLGLFTDDGYLYAFSELFHPSTQNEKGMNSQLIDENLYDVSYSPNSYFMYYDHLHLSMSDLSKFPTKEYSTFDVESDFYQTAFWYGTNVRFFKLDTRNLALGNFTSLEDHRTKVIPNYIMSDSFIESGTQPKNNKETQQQFSESIITSFKKEITETESSSEGDKQLYLTATSEWNNRGVSEYITASAANEAQKLALWLMHSEEKENQSELFRKEASLVEVNSLLITQNHRIMQILMEQRKGESNTFQTSVSQMTSWWEAATAYASDILSANQMGEFSDEQCEKLADDLENMLLTQKVKQE